MAYGTALNADDEEEKKQTAQNAFTASPSTPFGAPPSGGVATAATPAKTQTTGGGSGFVNLGRYINNASNDRGGKVANTGAATLGAEKASFDNAAQPLRAADSQLQAPSQDDIQNAWNTGRDDKLTTWANSSYAGPTSMNWQASEPSFTKLSNLVGPTTGFKEAYGNETSSGPYSLGNEMLDQALFRSDGKVAQAQDSLRRNSQEFLNNANTEQNALNEKGAGFAKKADDIKGSVRSVLQSQLDNSLAGLDARVAKTRQDEINRASGQGYDGKHWSTAPDQGGTNGVYREATGLNREGLATAAERNDYMRLAGLLGLSSPVIGQGPAYNAGRFQPIEDPRTKEEIKAQVEAGEKQKKANKNAERVAERKRNQGE